jgi:hypothetical protein
MQLTVVSVYDLRFMADKEPLGIVEGHMEGILFYIDYFLSYAESLNKFATQDLLESYSAEVIGIRVMYINVHEKIKLNDKIVGETKWRWLSGQCIRN